MVQRMRAEAAGPTGGAEPLFPGSRRSRSVWDAVRLEVGVPGSCPVVLHSFTQLDPDLPRLEVGEQGRPIRGRAGASIRGNPRPSHPGAARRAWGLPQSRLTGSGTGAGSSCPPVQPSARPHGAQVGQRRVPAAQLDLFPRLSLFTSASLPTAGARRLAG